MTRTQTLAEAGEELRQAWASFVITLGEEFRLFWLLDKMTAGLRTIGYA